MSDDYPASFEAIVAAYIAAPTRANYDELCRLADAYHEQWIEKRAAPGGLATDRDPAARYERKQGVTQLVYGVPVTLALQKRTGAGEAEGWWVLSWRTKYTPNGANRRFYMNKDGCWTIPAPIALGMIQIMDSEGGLAEQYDDRRRDGEFDVTISSTMSAEEKNKTLTDITGVDEKWGFAPFFVITSHPKQTRKKVLLINTDNNAATFRSITKDANYMPKETLREGATWWLDNYMMDASVQEMRVFYRSLASYCEQLDMGATFASE